MPATAEEITSYKDKLYELCLEDSDRIYYQNDLQGMEIIPNGDLSDLLRVIQALVDEKCFKMLQDHNGYGYKCRTVEDVKIYKSLNHDEDMVYSLIDEASSEGIWTRHIKLKTKLHDAVIKQVFKSLEKKKLISDFKTMEHPGKIYYIKSSVQPTERSTGGPWYTDNELDEDYIRILSDVLAKYIDERSWGKPSKHGLKYSVQQIEDIKALRDQAFAPKTQNGGPNATNDTQGSSSKKAKAQITFQANRLPLAPTYQRYPTLHDCTLYVMKSGATNVTLTEEDIQQLLDILRYDGRIERITGGPTGIAYKSIRKSAIEIEDGGKANGFTEAPCGRCPVFDLCEEGGPVGPSNCEYFHNWLSF